MYGSELAKDQNNNGSYSNCPQQDGQGNHIALVLPVDNLAVRTTTAHKRMGIRLLTVAARSCDGFEHPAILTCLQSFAIDPHQNQPADKKCYSSPETMEPVVRLQTRRQTFQQASSRFAMPGNARKSCSACCDLSPVR